MRKSLGNKIAIAALSLFLAGKSLSAFTPENVSEIKTAFESGNKSYLILQDGTVTPAKEEGKIILKDNKWISQEGKVMSNQFQNEVAKVLKTAKEKDKKGMKMVDFFEYKNAKGATNCFNLWSDGTISFGPYEIESKKVWFYDSNENGKFDSKDGYMSGSFNTKANLRMIAGLSELVSLREEKEKSEKEKAQYEKMIDNLNATIADYQKKAVSTKDMEDKLVKYNKKIEELTEKNARIESEYNEKVNGLEGKVAETLSQENSSISEKAKELEREKMRTLNNNSYKQGIDGEKAKKIPSKGETLTADAEIVSNKLDGEIGLRYDSGDFGIGAKIGIGMGGKETTNYEGTVSIITGRKAVGEIGKEDLLKLKAGLETRFGIFVAEGGIVYIPTNETTDEKIIARNGNVLSENSYSISGNKIDYFGGVGIEVGEVGKLKFRMLFGGETGKGVYGKLGIGIPLSKN